MGEDNPSITDDAVMHIAETEQRIILTFDRDYGELIFKCNYKPPQGIIYLHLEIYSPEEPGKYIHQLLSLLKIETAKCLTVFDGENLRQRKY
jgi:predicted nuclease of predicted toxin-antitoxin system